MCAWRVCLCGRAHVPPWLLVPGPSIKDESWAPSCGSSALPGALFSPCVPCEDVVDGWKGPTLLCAVSRVIHSRSPHLTAREWRSRKATWVNQESQSKLVAIAGGWKQFLLMPRPMCFFPDPLQGSQGQPARETGFTEGPGWDCVYGRRRVVVMVKSSDTCSGWGEIMQAIPWARVDKHFPRGPSRLRGKLEDVT